MIFFLDKNTKKVFLKKFKHFVKNKNKNKILNTL